MSDHEIPKYYQSTSKAHANVLQNLRVCPWAHQITYIVGCERCQMTPNGFDS